LDFVDSIILYLENEDDASVRYNKC